MTVFYEGKADTVREVSRDEALKLYRGASDKSYVIGKTRDRERHTWIRVCLVTIDKYPTYDMFAYRLDV